MRASSFVPFRLARLLPTLVTAGVALGACGGSSKPAPSDPTPPTDAPASATGTTGVPGLDWGAPADAVLARYPQGTADANGVSAMGMVDGHQALTVFTIGAGGLSQIAIEWVEGYISMEDCATGWTEVRAKVDARLGQSQADNLAAYWDTPTASVVLACSPNDNDAGVLSMNYSPRTEE